MSEPAIEFEPTVVPGGLRILRPSPWRWLVVVLPGVSGWVAFRPGVISCTALAVVVALALVAWIVRGPRRHLRWAVVWTGLALLPWVGPAINVGIAVAHYVSGSGAPLVRDFPGVCGWGNPSAYTVDRWTGTPNRWFGDSALLSEPDFIVGREWWGDGHTIGAYNGTLRTLGWLFGPIGPYEPYPTRDEALPRMERARFFYCVRGEQGGLYIPSLEFTIPATLPMVRHPANIRTSDPGVVSILERGRVPRVRAVLLGNVLLIEGCGWPTGAVWVFDRATGDVMTVYDP